MLGFSVYPNGKRADSELIKKFESVVTPHVSDSMNRLYGSSARLMPFHKKGKLIGSALTVKTRPGDNLMIHQAISMAQPGDVLVVDGGGDMTQALFGEIMLKSCQQKGIAGLVVNGCIRDVSAFREGAFPVFARGVTHKGPYKYGPGEVNVTVSFEGLQVNPGDIIIGDEDGVINIPIQEAEDVLYKVAQKNEIEKKKINTIEKEKKIESVVNDDMLKNMGCVFHN